MSRASTPENEFVDVESTSEWLRLARMLDICVMCALCVGYFVVCLAIRIGMDRCAAIFGSLMPTMEC